MNKNTESQFTPSEPEKAASNEQKTIPSPPSVQQKRRQKSVFQYIAILFAAAFALLLFTFLMERRQNELLQQQNQEQIDNLQQSVSAVQSLQDLYDENTTLKEKVDQLEDQVSALQSQYSQFETNSKQENESIIKANQALDWFWQINEAYVRGKYSLCRSLIGHLEKAGLVEALPKNSITNNGRFSPYDRYQEIYARVF